METLNVTAIMASMTKAFLKSFEGFSESSIKITQTSVLHSVVRQTRGGRLESGRSGNIRITEKDGMLYVALRVLGSGGLSISFSLFPEDATEERVQRYINHYKAAHDQAVIDEKNNSLDNI